MNKRKAIRRHFKKRSQERVGKSYSKHEQAQIGARIRDDQNASFIRRCSNTRTEWQIFWDGKVLRIIYDTLRHVPVTVLPMNERTKLTPLMEKLMAQHKEIVS